MKTDNLNTKTTLNIHILELVRLRIGYINECHYSINLHYNELKDMGESDLRLSLVAVWNEAPYFSEKECALFSLTDYIICTDYTLSLEQVHSALTPHFNEEQIVALTQAIQQIDLWTRSMKHLDAALL